MLPDRIWTMLQDCISSEKRHFAPTELYNEKWMLRLVLDFIENHGKNEFPLPFSENCSWHSEARLTTFFSARRVGKGLAETHTHADGVIGNFEIGSNGNTTDLHIKRDAKHLVVIEAKMSSKLSAKTTKAKYYNQAARTVACIAEVLRKGGKKPNALDILGFYVLAPKSRIDKPGVFDNELKKENIKETVQKRKDEYKDKHDEQDKEIEDWWNNWFLPTLEKIEIKPVSWEDVIEKIKEVDNTSGTAIECFYSECKKFNKLNNTKNNRNDQYRDVLYYSQRTISQGCLPDSGTYIIYNEGELRHLSCRSGSYAIRYDLNGELQPPIRNIDNNKLIIIDDHNVPSVKEIKENIESWQKYKENYQDVIKEIEKILKDSTEEREKTF